jgi:hypothetical protein
MFRFDVRSNLAAVARDLEVRDPKLLRRAVVSGLNAGMTSVRKETIKRGSADTGVAQKFLRERTTVFRASAQRLTALTRFVPRGLNPLKVGWNAGKADAYYRGPRASGAKAFVARMPNGAQQVVIRLPKSDAQSRDIRSTRSGGRKYKRLPIQSIRIFIGKSMIRDFQSLLGTVGLARFDEKVREYLNKRLPSVQPMTKVK